MRRVVIPTLLAVLVPLVASPWSRAEEPIPTDAADVVEDTKWSGEVRLARLIHVRAGATLRIAAGTRITVPWVDHAGKEPADKPGIEVFGQLVAEGDVKVPIRFEPEPKPADAKGVPWRRWRGILVHDSAPAARLARCLITGAETGFQPGSPFASASDCAFFDCATGVGVGVLWGSPNQVIRTLRDVAPTIEGCRFGHCDVGITVELAARPHVHRCVFFDCEAGIANDRHPTTYPVTGLGPFVDRCEFLRCKLAVGGPARVANSVFEANQLAYAGSRFGEVTVTSIDAFVRGRNLYWRNTALSRSDVPVGADAVFADPRRRGIPPRALSGEELLPPLDGVLGLAPGSPGLGAAGDGGDLGAFGAEGTVRGNAPLASSGPSLAIENWLHLGPGAPDAVALSGLAKDVASRQRFAGDVDGSAQWASFDGGALADSNRSRQILAEIPEPRTLLATLTSETEGNVSLRFGWDGTLVAYWNGQPLRLPDGPRRFRPDDVEINVARRKGPNALLIRHVPRMLTGRLAVGAVDPTGNSVQGGLSPAAMTPPDAAAGATPIAGASWSIERGPSGKPTGRGSLKITLASHVHWRDAVSLARLALVDSHGKLAELAGAGIQFQPKERVIVLTLSRPLASGAWRLRATQWRRASGEPFTPNPAEVAFRVP